ncbi:JAB domain-containing protein [Aeromonas salmonicida]|uniref:JAB domain-containing protein n=2 Tax=Aeromonas salmonicida TaxID=645 RepID=UPI00223E908D|nr:JAB domain-containing protein [Aeromonas salmonicida]
MLHHKLIAGEISGIYLVTELINEEDLLTIANQIARQKLAKGEAITDKHLAQHALQTLLQSREHEVFAMLFLDNQHRILAYEELFHGTLSRASVYPREVVKRALALNAAALMLGHNHPSEYPEPSQTDIEITHRLQSVLELVDIRLLDHLVVATEGIVPLADRGVGLITLAVVQSPFLLNSAA